MSEAVKPAEATNPIEGEASGKSLVTPEAEQKPEATATPKEDAPKTEEPKAESKPDAYELALEEGSVLSKDRLQKIETFAKAQGFSKDQAIALLKSEEEAVLSFAEARQNEYKQTVNKWVDAVKADPEIGGQSFMDNVKQAQSAVKQFATNEFIKLLDDTGFGNHPEVIRVFSRIAKQINPQKMVKASDVPPPSKTVEELFYGKQE